MSTRYVKVGLLLKLSGCTLTAVVAALLVFHSLFEECSEVLRKQDLATELHDGDSK